MGQKSSPLSPSFNGRVIKDDQNDRFYVTDSNNIPVALLGKDSAGNIVVKVAKSGQNVITAPDNELIFNSQQDTFKIVASGTSSYSVNIAATAGICATYDTGYNTIAHNLGYSPAVLVFEQNNTAPVASGTLYSDSYTYSSTGFAYTDVYNLIYVDNTNLYLGATWRQIASASSVSAPAVTSTISYKYYLLQETAT